MTKKRKAPLRKTCADCKKSMTLTNFYATTSSLYPDKRLHICRNCSLKIVEEEGFEGFQDLMKLINKPIYEDLYKDDVGDYIRQLNSLPQWRGVVYEDSTLFNEPRSREKITREKPKELSEEDLKESEEFWGSGKSEEHYMWLNAEFSDYLSRYEVDSKTLEDLIIEICLTRLDIRTRRENGQDVDKQIKTLNDLMGSANLKPVQETGATAVEQETFGTLIKKWENERPIPEPDESWKDVDNIGKYIRTFFLGHMARMFDKENPFQEEYEEEIQKYTVEPPKRDD